MNLAFTDERKELLRQLQYNRQVYFNVYHLLNNNIASNIRGNILHPVKAIILHFTVPKIGTDSPFR